MSCKISVLNECLKGDMTVNPKGHGHRPRALLYDSQPVRHSQHRILTLAPTFLQTISKALSHVS